MEKDSFYPLNFAVLTLSDTRTSANDSSGDYLAFALDEFGHKLLERDLIKDCTYQLRATVSKWIAMKDVQVILVTGGTGLTGRDITPEAIEPLFDKKIDGFGEMFRYFSLEDIGTSTIQSRAVAGLANGTLIFALPGSTGACRLAWNKILRIQLDSRTKPCNFVSLISRFLE